MARYKNTTGTGPSFSLTEPAIGETFAWSIHDKDVRTTNRFNSLFDYNAGCYQSKRMSDSTAKNPQPPTPQRAAAYWQANLKVVASLLCVWFVVSFGFGIIAVDTLNKIQFFGFKFGFWWAQQGSIYVFVMLVFVYAWLMHRIDRKYGVADTAVSERSE